MSAFKCISSPYLDPSLTWHSLYFATVQLFSHILHRISVWEKKFSKLDLAIRPFSILNTIYDTKNAFCSNSNTLWIRSTFRLRSMYNLRFLMCNTYLDLSREFGTRHVCLWSISSALLYSDNIGGRMVIYSGANGKLEWTSCNSEG